ncbi:MAG: ketohydroxyglutarate aldolase [Erysipelotrichaceae bacterium]|nr:ketohydroxyglutarate aldolase [Erysipelotrichaceae bacterium]
MQKNETVSHIAKTKVMAVVRIDSLERGIEICEGCLAGGVDVMEISYTSENADEYIRQLNQKYKGRMLIGAGTVLDAPTARNAILAGARFIIAPTFSKEVALMCNRYQIPYAPGCTSYSEMVEALEYGASFIKCFPISNFYGPELVKIVKTPLPFMPLMISGGITLDNVRQWLDNGADCLAVGGLLTKGSSQDIAANAAKLMAEVNK